MNIETIHVEYLIVSFIVLGLIAANIIFMWFICFMLWVMCSDIKDYFAEKAKQKRTQKLKPNQLNKNQ